MQTHRPKISEPAPLQTLEGSQCRVRPSFGRTWRAASQAGTRLTAPLRALGGNCDLGEQFTAAFLTLGEIGSCKPPRGLQETGDNRRAVENPAMCAMGEFGAFPCPMPHGPRTTDQLAIRMGNGLTTGNRPPQQRWRTLLESVRKGWPLRSRHIYPEWRSALGEQALHGVLISTTSRYRVPYQPVETRPPESSSPRSLSRTLRPAQTGNQGPLPSKLFPHRLRAGFLHSQTPALGRFGSETTWESQAMG